eukprot:CAMPEP_0119121836 /NCGR_PEP_ID=MMETSP1310-20130426/2279_1 /TAXON_ID=464262 /ORGANISM="Genus nov. species nov., Strain RCC2339" /LENGTH=428 /DNA_ID=CAMNT_0007111417 /DNA_START=42 /DNA_END=1328 /DNA_ORIENTATION=+
MNRAILGSLTLVIIVLLEHLECSRHGWESGRMGRKESADVPPGETPRRTSATEARSDAAEGRHAMRRRNHREARKTEKAITRSHSRNRTHMVYQRRDTAIKGWGRWSSQYEPRQTAGKKWGKWSNEYQIPTARYTGPFDPVIREHTPTGWVRFVVITPAYPGHDTYFQQQLARLQSIVEHHMPNSLAVTWLISIDLKNGSGVFHDVVRKSLLANDIAATDLGEEQHLSDVIRAQKRPFRVVLHRQKQSFGDGILNWLHSQLPDESYMFHMDYDNLIPCGFFRTFLSIYRRHPDFAGSLHPILYQGKIMVPFLRFGYIDTACFVANAGAMRKSKASYCPKKGRKHCPHKFPDANMILQFSEYAVEHGLPYFLQMQVNGYHNAIRRKLFSPRCEATCRTNTAVVDRPDLIPITDIFQLESPTGSDTQEPC